LFNVVYPLGILLILKLLKVYGLLVYQLLNNFKQFYMALTGLLLKAYNSLAYQLLNNFKQFYITLTGLPLKVCFCWLINCLITLSSFI
jgi:hypothetical protein